MGQKFIWAEFYLIAGFSAPLLHISLFFCALNVFIIIELHVIISAHALMHFRAFNLFMGKNRRRECSLLLLIWSHLLFSLRLGRRRGGAWMKPASRIVPYFRPSPPPPATASGTASGAITDCNALSSTIPCPPFFPEPVACFFSPGGFPVPVPRDHGFAWPVLSVCICGGFFGVICDIYGECFWCFLPNTQWICKPSAWPEISLPILFTSKGCSMCTMGRQVMKNMHSAP